MSYIDRLNSFFLWLESHALEPVSQLLYLHLLNVFNRAGWPESVQVDNVRITAMTGQRSEKTATAARDRLVSAGLISYQRGKKNSPGRYTLIPIPCIKYGENNTVENIHRISYEQSGGETGSYSGGNPATPLQPYKDKEVTSYEESFPPNPPEGETGESPAEPAPEPTPVKGAKRAKARQEFPSAPFFPDNPVLEKAAAEWLAYKRERKEPYKTALGMNKLISRMRENAARYGAEAVAAVIDESMSSDYQGIVWNQLPQKARELARNGGGQTTQGRPSWAELAEEVERGMKL